MKSRYKERLLPEVPHQTLSPKLIYSKKKFKHKNWGNGAISPKIFPHSPPIQTTLIEVLMASAHSFSLAWKSISNIYKFYE